jgi:hypothetical protein
MNKTRGRKYHATVPLKYHSSHNFLREVTVDGGNFFFNFEGLLYLKETMKQKINGAFKALLTRKFL